MLSWRERFRRQLLEMDRRPHLYAEKGIATLIAEAQEGGDGEWSPRPTLSGRRNTVTLREMRRRTRSQCTTSTN